MVNYKDKILQGDALSVLKTLPDSLVDCVMTSPPYWGLRAYGTNPIIWDAKEGCKHEWGVEKKKPINLQAGSPEFKRKWRESATDKDSTSGSLCKKCSAWRGELGTEPNFSLYIKHLCDIFDEVKRVLKPEGSVWINLGDTYGTQGGQNRKTDKDYSNYDSIKLKNTEIGTELIKQKGYHKCLLNIPARFSTEMINRGWILRNIIIWHKPSCMPSSANDRFTSDYEFLYFFVKQESYYFEQQFEKMKPESLERWKGEIKPSVQKRNAGGIYPQENAINTIHKIKSGDILNKEGRNKRCVWSINNKGYSEAHFATYCEELCYTPIKATCPLYICKECGKPREKIIEKETRFESGSGKSGNKPEGKWKNGQQENSGKYDIRMGPVQEIKDKGWTDCGCGKGFDSGIVCDPFSGSGTTGLAAKNLGRHYLGIDLNSEYVKMARKRLSQLYLL